MAVTPEQIRDGQLIRYFPSPAKGFVGCISGKPWQLGSGHWVVRVVNLEPEYALLGTGRNSVSAAGLEAIEIIPPWKPTDRDIELTDAYRAKYEQADASVRQQLKENLAAYGLQATMTIFRNQAFQALNAVGPIPGRNCDRRG